MAKRLTAADLSKLNVRKVSDEELRSFDFIVVSSSGGKDSQAQLHEIVTQAARAGVLDRVVVVHADLGRVEWKGTKALAQEQAEAYGVNRFEVVANQLVLIDAIEKRFDDLQVRARELDAVADGLERGASWNSLINHVSPVTARCMKRLAKKHNGLTSGIARKQAQTDRDNPVWPDSQSRYCTSDFKTGPIKTLFTKLAAEFDSKGAGRRCRILNCIGLRAQESGGRAKKIGEWKNGEFVQHAESNSGAFEYNAPASTKTTREVWNYLPIVDWDEQQVWDTILESGVRYHEAYDLGMPRLSCVFCVFGSKSALTIAGEHNPELLAEYVKVEEKIGKTFTKRLSLKELQADIAAGAHCDKAEDWDA
jgi:3'-phosphoadenosine 5'-phosphosulfate sulfotransferase (PAPS reductase)/FAD synthetase